MTDTPKRYARLLLRGRHGSRLRAEWRVLLVFTLFFALVAAVELLTGLLPLPELAGDAATRVGLLVATAAAVAVGARWIDRRPVASYGFDLGKRWWWDLAWGVVLGVALHGVMALSHLALGWASLGEVLSPAADRAGRPLLLGLGSIFLVFLATAVWEETLFRGVLLRNAVEGIGKHTASPARAVTAAWVLSAVVFGLVHVFASLGHEHIPVWVVVIGATVSGVYFSLAYALTGSLGFPIGLHLGSDFADAAVFGSATAPYDGYPALLRLQTEFPGAWESAGGLALVMAVLTVAAVAGWACLTRGRLAYEEGLLRAASGHDGGRGEAA